ncbi:MAG: hypothetical protein KUG68_08015 [Flavobacteriaceae bacterium]|nr:hypothetical protein [Flavobacteriaceae bacterium]
MNKPSKCISEQEARNLQDNWVTTRGASIQNSRGQEDSREVVFSVADLEEFLSYVKSESTKQGIKDPGVRVYFAAYNNAKSTKSTVFLSPTTSSSSDADNNYNLSPFNTVIGGFPPKVY